MILFVDDCLFRAKDIEGRLKKARITSSGLPLVHLRYPSEVWQYHLESARLIMLDHDMCMFPGSCSGPYSSCGCRTGYDLVTRILSSTQVSAPIIVHSANPAGAERMLAAIMDSGASYADFSAKHCVINWDRPPIEATVADALRFHTRRPGTT